MLAIWLITAAVYWRHALNPIKSQDAHNEDKKTPQRPQEQLKTKRSDMYLRVRSRALLRGAREGIVPITWQVIVEEARAPVQRGVQTGVDTTVRSTLHV